MRKFNIGGRRVDGIPDDIQIRAAQRTDQSLFRQSIPACPAADLADFVDGQRSDIHPIEFLGFIKAHVIRRQV